MEPLHRQPEMTPPAHTERYKNHGLISKIGWETRVYSSEPRLGHRFLSHRSLQVIEEDLTHLSPARFEHVNPYGKYLFPIDQALQRRGPRPLRAA